MLYTKGCDLVDAHWPESEIIDYPLTGDEQSEMDKAVENARRQALAAANDLMRVYSMLGGKLTRSLLDNIMLLGLPHAVEPLEVGAEQENWQIP